MISRRIAVVSAGQDRHQAPAADRDQIGARQQAVDAIDAAVVRAELALQVEAVLRGRAAFQIAQADGVDLDVDDRLAGHRRYRASDDAALDHAYVGRVTGPVILLL